MPCPYRFIPGGMPSAAVGTTYTECSPSVTVKIHRHEHLWQTYQGMFGKAKGNRNWRLVEGCKSEEGRLRVKRRAADKGGYA